MSDINPGIHPNFDMSKFEVSQQRVLRRLSQITHVTRDGEVHLGSDTTYRYALVRPLGQMRGLLHTDREVMVLFSDFPEFQSRTLDAFDRILSEISDEFRVEKVARILVSDDPSVATKIRKLFESKPDAPVVVPFHSSELVPSAQNQNIASRIREFTFSRDLFSMSSPLRGDLYFYGRSSLINEICSKLSSGENFGLFGLRRSGKTSIVHGISRAIKVRSGDSVIVDCQSPTVHQRRWFELLEHIAKVTKEKLGSKAVISKSDKYDEKDAADTFLRDMRAIKKNSKVGFISILFDEIERISFGTASSDHWNSDRDFLLFWQAIRSGFQSSSSPFSFLIVGTNPSAVEKIKIFESDNPLFGNVEKRFIPMFTPLQVDEMVDDLGAIMGVHIDSECKSRLYADFGGHPFLTRYACSYIANSIADRPVEVDRTVYAHGVNRFKTESNSYVDSVVGLLKDEYPEEFEMLKFLGAGDQDSFKSFAESDPTLCEHLTGYGIVARGVKSFYFRIGVVERYFENATKPVVLLDQGGRLAEISARRNGLERDLRALISQVFRMSFSQKDRLENVVSKVSPSRRPALSAYSFSDILAAGESPLYFDELKTIVLGHWDRFSNMLEMEKNEFEYHMTTINKSRSDAHAKDIDDQKFEKWRVSIGEISSRIAN
ncbi:hypothetical protein C8J45_11913 [Sphingomonas sp. PP-CE-3G-477]|uniref:ATP-binding protein n=1 Tax=Sphingomonas sp. PP-CE-3G-477 TaxID=2135660 RepID=UPI000D448FAF|nr:ATP-binding protein [Sphingomonas sp. PP-CE-3G-477]PTQ58589.1 hypothetical protein C8J45_11913 [Sphingomonas sp. PP-CE-3G-477]